jgi:hypothetical protein
MVYQKKMGFWYGVILDSLLYKERDYIKNYFYEILPQIPLYDTKLVQKMFERQEVSGKYNVEIMDILIVCIWWENNNF